MNWNPVLTKVKRFFGIKKKMPKPVGRQPDHEPIPQLVSIKEAVEALPEEMIKARVLEAGLKNEFGGIE